MIGDRMKQYENVTRFHLTPRIPVITRIDGRAFSTFCRTFSPFNQLIIDGMIKATMAVAKEMQGFKIAYIQSDEANLVMTDYDDITTQGWFNYNVNKIVSISAAIMTANFGAAVKHPMGLLPIFDARTFNVPENDVANVLLWRAQDWKRNSVSMHARRFFSHKQLHQKSQQVVLDMLSKDHAWKDLPDQHRLGTFIVKTQNGIEIFTNIEPTYLAISALVNPIMPKKL